MLFSFFFNDTATTEIYTLSLHDALPIYALWPELTDIVFMVRHPAGKSGGGSSDHYASTHDVAPTILGFLGMESPDRKSTRLNSSHSQISYAVFCLKKKKQNNRMTSSAKQ